MAPTSAPSTPQSSIDAIAPHPVLSSVVGAAAAVEVLADSVWLWAAGEPVEGPLWGLSSTAWRVGSLARWFGLSRGWILMWGQMSW